MPKFEMPVKQIHIQMPKFEMPKFQAIQVPVKKYELPPIHVPKIQWVPLHKPGFAIHKPDFFSMFSGSKW
ncbi:hypothetical protein Anas_05937 [Armadillidium nasatum]|uniref:Uncharacterized protein n=1 Tax=Armadillidium nasatum TaxID=96803 RepID=A0A5N5TF35_9CRUS|nr:hypothetical protein Anas_05937 [Armadillidium nasatum]